jgi:hypothetical protein
MATARTRSVGTKLTEDEYAKLEPLAAARGLTVGEWVRQNSKHPVNTISHTGVRARKGNCAY